jgi:peptidoglycan/xylan/chitin deacetylase (PgdA/CDA1 family)
LVTVGSHGYEHVPLAARDESAVRRDLEEVDRLLADWTGSSPDHFSYPYGSVGPAARRVVADRYASAVGTDARPVRPRDWRRPHKLPRFDGADRTQWSDTFLG